MKGESKPVHKATSRMAGYARRRGVLGDIHRITSERVSGVTHDGRSFSWKRGPDVEIIEFGSFNPDNDNYLPGGRPWEGGQR
jgi:hypothetical protein